MKITKFWKLYPTVKKKPNISSLRVKVSQSTRKKLQNFGKEYFDGQRKHGYGGYYYNKKFFRNIVKEIIKHYKLNNNSKILDIGCAKGFMMHEFKYFLPKCEVKGIDISSYTKKTALDKMKKHIKVGSCQKLPYKNEYFDFVISISTIHNLSPSKLHLAIREIERVKKNTGKSFIRVKGFKTFKEKKFIEDWNVVAKSNVSIKRWLKIFKKENYKGDYDFSNY